MLQREYSGNPPKIANAACHPGAAAVSENTWFPCTPDRDGKQSKSSGNSWTKSPGRLGVPVFLTNLVAALAMKRTDPAKYLGDNADDLGPALERVGSGSSIPHGWPSDGGEEITRSKHRLIPIDLARSVRRRIPSRWSAAATGTRRVRHPLTRADARRAAPPKASSGMASGV
jgi:hypothetical protein